VGSVSTVVGKGPQPEPGHTGVPRVVAGLGERQGIMGGAVGLLGLANGAAGAGPLAQQPGAVGVAGADDVGRVGVVPLGRAEI